MTPQSLTPGAAGGALVVGAGLGLGIAVAQAVATGIIVASFVRPDDRRWYIRHGVLAGAGLMLAAGALGAAASAAAVAALSAPSATGPQ